METKEILERIVDERKYYEKRLNEVQSTGNMDLANFFEGKICGLLFAEGTMKGA